MSGATKELLDGEEVAEVLSGTFYARGGRAHAGPQQRSRRVVHSLNEARPLDEARPDLEAPAKAHYKVICISLYNEDLQRLDAMVDELKGRGITKANRSALIRFALETVDLDKVRRGM